MNKVSAREQFRFRLQNILKIISRPYIGKYILPSLRIAAGLGLLTLSIQGIRWDDLVDGIKSADLNWLGLAIGSVLVGLLLKLWRWAIFVNNYHLGVGIGKLFQAYFVGQAANILLPFRGGELVRMSYFAREPKILPEIAVTIAIEKYLDLVGLTICALLVSLKFSLENIMNMRSWLLPLTITSSVLFMVALVFGPTVWRKVRRNIKVPKALAEWLDRFIEASEWLRNPKHLSRGVSITVLIWLVMWSTNLLLFKSFGLGLGGTAAGLVLLLVYLGLLPALMPGNIGPFYFFASLALLPFGIEHNTALAFAIVLHGIVTLPTLLGGVAGIYTHGDNHPAT